MGLVSFELATLFPVRLVTILAIDKNTRQPKDSLLPLRVVYMSGQTLKMGVECHQVEGVPIQMYCPAKTVVDCFNFRNKIGFDVALQALRKC
jgi:hypothetical protein